nr:hypothetical protein [Tanacetum cinerariifolium]
MADLPASPDHVPASPDHVPVIPDHLPGSPGPEPTFLDHVVDFPDDDLAVEIEEGPKEDQDMNINEEDPMEDQGMDFETDDEIEEYEDDEDWLITPVTPPRAVTPVYSTYKVGGPSSTEPEAPHLVGHPLSIVAFCDALHHQELTALHVRLDGVESIQTEVRWFERAIMRDVGWLGERDEIIQRRTLSLVRRVDGLSDDRVADSIVILELPPRMNTIEEILQTLIGDAEYIQDVLDVVDTKIAELRDRVDDYPCKQVDTLRVEVDGLHGSAMTTCQRVQTLETTLQEARAEIQDLRIRLSASESNERCLITFVLGMDERISELEQRTLGPHGSSSSSS